MVESTLRLSHGKTISAAAPTPRYYANPVRMVKHLWSVRELIWQFAKRDVTQRYRGSYLGIFWSLANPFLMLAVYTFVFGVIFKNRWGADTSDSRVKFALILFSGIIVFNIFADTINRAPGLITGNRNYVKKVVFPLEILPLSVLVSSIVQAGLSLSILLVGMVAFGQPFSPTMLLFPLVLVPLFALTLGLAWFLSSLSVFIQDVAHAVSIVVTILMFLSAVFYPASVFPAEIQGFMKLNPLLLLVEDARNTLMMGQLPHWQWLGGLTVLSLVVLQLGYVWFMKTKRWFSDVI